MSTTASFVNPSSVNNDNNNNKYVIPHPVTDANPSKTALEAGAARNEYQHSLVQVSKGKMGGGEKRKNKNKKSKKYNRKSTMKKRFSKKFRRSILRKKTKRMSVHKKNKKTSLYGGANTNANGDNNNDNKLTIPSFRQTSPTGSSIINQLAGNHAQTLAYSAYDDQVSKPVF
jgi:hypothetical protein